ncbi:hypothetical protein [Candidatus Nitrosotenuis aquarius]|uniref:hypothetical protein n=1 Tax=Candidatus Nitrosotenuis aquarius TaxID=1846278 RepID=UPI000C1F1A3E|nr:hypothetical protein [Candidatus Nitrosotenuis aquarius]
MKAELAVLLLIVASFPLASAQSVFVQTSKATYNYGDYLSVTISVSSVTGKNAILHIIDSEGIKSSGIPVQITKQNTTITTPVPFNSELFREGKYQIQVEYNGIMTSAPFLLVDIGNIVMPFGSNVIVPQWLDGAISDSMFFKFLVEKETVKLPAGQKLEEKTEIPDWYKINGKWWSERKISDSEFVRGLQYLVNQKII